MTEPLQTFYEADLDTDRMMRVIRSPRCRWERARPLLVQAFGFLHLPGEAAECCVVVVKLSVEFNEGKVRGAIKVMGSIFYF